MKLRNPILKQLDEDIAVIQEELELRALEKAIDEGVWLVKVDVDGEEILQFD